LAAEKEELEKQVKDLQSDLETSKLSRSDTQLFLQEVISTNDKGLSIRKSFFSLVGTIQEMQQNLSLNKKVLNQQKEELHMMMEVRRKVSEYQKQTKADQVKKFSLMELKRFQVILNSGENLMEEAGGIISDAKKECDRIWESVSTLIDEARLPRVDKSRTISSDDVRMEMVETTHRAKRETLQHLKELIWEDIKLLLVDEIRSQTQIEAWSAGAEVNIRKRIMKSVCQSNLMVEG